MRKASDFKVRAEASSSETVHNLWGTVKNFKCVVPCLNYEELSDKTSEPLNQVHGPSEPRDLATVLVENT